MTSSSSSYHHHHQPPLSRPALPSYQQQQQHNSHHTQTYYPAHPTEGRDRSRGYDPSNSNSHRYGNANVAGRSSYLGDDSNNNNNSNNKYIQGYDNSRYRDEERNYNQRNSGHHLAPAYGEDRDYHSDYPRHQSSAGGQQFAASRYTRNNNGGGSSYGSSHYSDYQGSYWM